MNVKPVKPVTSVKNVKHVETSVINVILKPHVQYVPLPQTLTPKEPELPVPVLPDTTLKLPMEMNN